MSGNYKILAICRSGGVTKFFRAVRQQLCYRNDVKADSGDNRDGDGREGRWGRGDLCCVLVVFP